MSDPEVRSERCSCPIIGMHACFNVILDTWLCHSSGKEKTSATRNVVTMGDDSRLTRVPCGDQAIRRGQGHVWMNGQGAKRTCS